MPVVGVLAAALALLASEGDRNLLRGTLYGPSRTVAARLDQGIPLGGYVAGLVDALAPCAILSANGPVHDGMSLRELRSGDRSGQTTVPLLAGRF